MNYPEKTVIFDLDGTLIDTISDIKTALDISLSNYGIEPLPTSVLKTLVGKGSKILIEKTLKNSNIHPSSIQIKNILKDFLYNYKTNISKKSTPFPGIINTLEWLSQNQIKTAVCTNKYESFARLLINNLGLDIYFHAITGGDTFEFRKPHQDHIFKTIEIAGGSANKSVMIGDSITDINAAKNASIPVIAVSWGYSDVDIKTLDADFTIDHGSEIIPTIKKIFNKM